MQRPKERKGLFPAIRRLGIAIVRIGTSSRHQKAFLLGLVGLGLILAAHLSRFASYFPEFLPTIFLEIGIACIIAAIAEFILLDHAIAAIREELQYEKQLVLHCSEHQLEDIIAPRRQESSGALVEIAKAIRVAKGDVCILGLSLQDFLTDGQAPYDALRSLLNGYYKISGNKISVKMLLIDPTSDAAKIRANAEQGTESLDETELCIRVRRSISRIKWLMRTAEDSGKKRVTIEARFYNALPSFYMISTSTTIFIEPYHFGSNSGGMHYIGGTAPILRFNSKSLMYGLAESHFSYIWDSKSSANETANAGRYDGKLLRVIDIDQVSKNLERRSIRRDRRADPPSRTYPGPERRSGGVRRVGRPIVATEDERAFGRHASTG